MQILHPERGDGADVYGNTLQGEYTDALGKYAMALSYINEDFMIQLQGPHAVKAQSLKTPIHLNMAACQIKVQDWHGVVWNCSQVRCFLPFYRHHCTRMLVSVQASCPKPACKRCSAQQ